MLFLPLGVFGYRPVADVQRKRNVFIDGSPLKICTTAPIFLSKQGFDFR
jgi:hypothetical protein